MVLKERWWNVIRMRFRSLLKRSQVERELDQELRLHLELQVEENLNSGMPPDEARNAALRRLGGVAQIKEECRDKRRTQSLETLWRDLSHARRALGRSPGFTLVVLLTLALSIGANSAIFSVIDGVLLKPLPYPHADRIVRLFFSSNEYPKFPLQRRSAFGVWATAEAYGVSSHGRLFSGARPPAGVGARI
jgi:hypothetical protein